MIKKKRATVLMIIFVLVAVAAVVFLFLSDMGADENANESADENTTSSSTVSDSDKDKVTDTVEITDDDIYALERIISAYKQINSFDVSYFGSAEEATKEILTTLIADGFSLPIYGEYIDPNYTVDSYDSYDNEFYKVAEEDIEWLVENVYNAEYTRLESEVSSDADFDIITYYRPITAYFEDGYYIISGETSMSESYSFTVTGYQQNDDGTYAIFGDLYFNADMEQYYEKTLEIVAAVRITDGKRHLSFYSINITDADY